MITVSHEFHGMSDYWGGNGRRWDDNAGCLFAYYDHNTTLRDCVDQWVDDFNMGGDCDSLPEDITGEDIREAILDSLTGKGRADYESGALCEFAANCDRPECPYCGEECDDENGCDGYMGDVDGLLEHDDCLESPIWVILVEYEAPDTEDDWTLCQHDDGHWLWAHCNGEEVGPFDDEESAWEGCPFCVLCRKEFEDKDALKDYQGRDVHFKCWEKNK